MWSIDLLAHVAAVSIGLPSCIIAPNTTHPWPAGISNVHDTFTIPNVPNFQAMAHVPIHMVVGTNNLDMPCLMLYEAQMQQSMQLGEQGWNK